MAKIAGSYSNDVLKGSEEKDYIWGLPGFDTIDGGRGDDLVDGGAGWDVLSSSSGYDRLDGGAGDDQIILTGTGGAVTGGVGYDGLIVDLTQGSEPLVFNGASGHGYVGDPSAGDGHIFFHDIEWLRLLAGSGDDRITGTAKSDRISTGDGNDVVNAGAGQDIITNTGGHDRLDGGDGNDRFVLVGTGSTVFGGAGDDTLVADLSALVAPVVFNLENGHGIIGYQTPEERHLFVEYHDVERIVLTTGRGSDHVTGSALRDVIETAGGNDFVDAGAGDDSITDGLGANHLFGGDGNDGITSTLYSAEIDGGAGRDWLYIKETQRLSGLTIDFGTGQTSTGTVLRGIEGASLVLGSGDDRVIAGNLDFLWVDGRAGDDHIEGGAGADMLDGGDGDDRIEGGAGDDRISTGLGDDVASGGDGRDTLASGGGRDILDGGAGDDSIRDDVPDKGSLGVGSIMRAGAGDDWLTAYFRGEVDGGEGQDRLVLSLGALPEAIDFDATRGATQTGLTFANVEDFTVTTGLGNDLLRGADGVDYFYGMKGNDILEGRGGDDNVYGDSGTDQLFGGDGADFLDGGANNDLLSGGNGADTFLWSTEVSGQAGIDRILDFETWNGDRIAFSAEAQNATGIHSYADFVAAAADTDAGVLIAFNGSDAEGILIEDVSLSTLSESDVVFGLG